MRISPDEWVFWTVGSYELSATIIFTWMIMLLLVITSILITRRLSDKDDIPLFQNFLEVLVSGLFGQIQGVLRKDPGRYLPFVGTLFIFIAVSNLLTIVPGYAAPTGSLSTTTALAISVFVAVPVFGIASRGVLGYLKQYIQPTPFMLPFTVISEFSRTIALAIRLYGNIMSGAMIVGILVSITPIFFPIVMELLGLLTGLVQAYIFAVLAMVYIASAAHAESSKEESDKPMAKET
jgi:F-type H+-transporting ATPase subunit a